MQVRLHVRRTDADTKATRWQDYTTELPPYGTVLDGLLQVREEQDGSLALRCSCRSAICGSCNMRINGHARLACITKVSEVAPDGGPITVEPAGNQPVIKDLVVDLAPFFQKVRQVQPYLQPEGPPPEREYLVDHDAMVQLNPVMACIMCGACVSDCTALEVDSNFLGPAALAKAFRVVADPRDGQKKARLELLTQPTGIWDCAHCFECVQQCPKGVAPMERIMALREEARKEGVWHGGGARHSDEFARSVGHSGRLDEFRLMPVSTGFFNVPGQLQLLPGAARLVRRGKLPSPIHRSIPGVQGVRRLFAARKRRDAGVDGQVAQQGADPAYATGKDEK
jgi:succinate dehydrogenase / fumarate reductase iron-sulfur subunit